MKVLPRGEKNMPFPAGYPHPIKLILALFLTVLREGSPLFELRCMVAMAQGSLELEMVQVLGELARVLRSE